MAKNHLWSQNCWVRFGLYSRSCVLEQARCPKFASLRKKTRLVVNYTNMSDNLQIIIKKFSVTSKCPVGPEGPHPTLFLQGNYKLHPTWVLNPLSYRDVSSLLTFNDPWLRWTNTTQQARQQTVFSSTGLMKTGNQWTIHQANSTATNTSSHESWFISITQGDANTFLLKLAHMSLVYYLQLTSKYYRAAH